MSDFAKLAAGLEKLNGPNAKTATVSHWLDTGYEPLNHAISGSYDGGMPSGRIVEIFGPPSAGKTAIATQAMIAAQRAGGVAVFDDFEKSFSEKLAAAQGLDLTPGLWNYYMSKSYEDGVKLFIKTVRFIRAEKIIPADKPIVWVWDSLASMIPADMLNKDADKINMNDSTAMSRLTSLTFKVIAHIVEECNVLFIVLNQIRTKVGVMFGDPTTTPGGDAPKFYASLRIQLGATRIMTGQDGDKVMIGSEVTARCVKNKTNRPYMAAKWRFMFRDDGTGYFDVVGSLIDFMLKKKVLEQAGAYIVWTDGKKYHRGPLVEKIEKEGLLSELRKVLIASGASTDEMKDEDLLAGAAA
jgi:recombination protein RecA